MRTAALIFISTIIISSVTASEEKSYKRIVTVCEDLRTTGIKNFRVIFTALYSQKFANGTFEGVTCLADEMVKVAEECCKDDSSPDCSVKGISRVMAKACGDNSSFPKNSGIEKCCSLQEHERTQCLAKLHYPIDELPSLLEPTPEEICTQYTQDPSSYAMRYVYEFARRHQSIPAGFVLNATQNYVRMAESCCSPSASKPCFFKERFQQGSFMSFLRFLSNVCSSHVYLKSYQTGLTAYFGSLLKVPFEEASAISKQFHSGLAKCCLKSQPECIIEEFTSFQKLLCKKSILDTMSEEFQKCCSQIPLDTLTCVDNLKRKPLKSPDMSDVPRAQLCEKDQAENTDRYLFQIGVKHASVSLPVLTNVQDQIKRTVAACCSAPDDTTACLKTKESTLGKTVALLTKMDSFCSQYFKLEFSAFKTMVQQEIQGDEAERRVQAWVDLATTCCSHHSPAHLCQKLTEAVIKHEDDATA